MMRDMLSPFEQADFVARHYNVDFETAREHVMRSSALGLDATLLETHLIVDELEGKHVTIPSYKSIASFLQAWCVSQGAYAQFDSRKEYQVTDPDERKYYNITDDAIAVRGCLIDSVAQATFHRQVQSIVDALKAQGLEVTSSDVLKRIEHEYPAPTITWGLGIAYNDEYIDPKYKMTRYQLAALRMQRNAINQRVPLTTFQNLITLTNAKHLSIEDFADTRGPRTSAKLRTLETNLKSEEPFA